LQLKLSYLVHRNFSEGGFQLISRLQDKKKGCTGEGATFGEFSTRGIDYEPFTI